MGKAPAPRQARNEQVVHDRFRLGKHEAVHDKRTLKLADFLHEAIVVPQDYDFDSTRKYPFKDATELLGNDQYGDCVLVTVARNWSRAERFETVSLYEEGLTEKQVVDQYFRLTGGVDSGLNMPNTLGWWRSSGWTLALPGRQSFAYKIAAYGSLPTGRSSAEIQTLKQAIFSLRGVQLGFALPLTAQADTNRLVWDYHPGSPGNAPGSWGGHAVYSSTYSSDPAYPITVYTWGLKVKVSAAFLFRYCDEALGVVDALDGHASKYLNVPAMIAQLKLVASNVEGG